MGTLFFIVVFRIVNLPKDLIQCFCNLWRLWMDDEFWKYILKHSFHVLKKVYVLFYTADVCYEIIKNFLNKTVTGPNRTPMVMLSDFEKKRSSYKKFAKLLMLVDCKSSWKMNKNGTRNKQSMRCYENRLICSVCLMIGWDDTIWVWGDKTGLKSSSFNGSLFFITHYKLTSGTSSITQKLNQTK